MKYAKLVDGAIVYAPRKLPLGDAVIYNPTEEMLTEAGYKPVRYTEPPTVEPGYIAIPVWTETAEEIVQTWAVELEPVTEDKALTRFSNKLTGAEDETLVEATETLIKHFKEEE